MIYEKELYEGILLRRYKRFLADVIVNNEQLTVHCPNSGSMAGLVEKGNPVRISGPYGNKRKYAFTLEQICITREDGKKVWVGVNTAIPNKIVHEALKNKFITGFEDYNTVRPEVKSGDHSRIDFFLSEGGLPPCWIEVKNCTLVQADPHDKTTINKGAIATFPDAVTSRGTKHLNELMRRKSMGERAVMIYTVQRSDANSFSPAYSFDPTYSENFWDAVNAGIEVIPIKAKVSKSGIILSDKRLTVIK